MENRYEKIEFNVERDFSETFNVSFKFLKQNFKPLLITLLFLAGPFLLVTALVGGIFTQKAFDFTAIMNGGQSGLEMFTPMYFLTILFSIISLIVLMGITYEYMLLYEEKGFAGFEVKDVWKAFVKDLGAILSTFFGLLLIVLIFMVTIGILIGLLSLMGTAGSIVIGIFTFLIIIGTLIILPPLIFLFSAVYLIVIREKLGFWPALSKTRFLLKDNFWNTWVVIFIAYLIVSILSMGFAMPQAVAVGVAGFHSLKGGGGEDYSILVIVLSMIGIFGGALVKAFLYIMIGFHYSSLNEQKQGTGLLSQIENIGADNSKDEDITI